MQVLITIVFFLIVTCSVAEAKTVKVITNDLGGQIVTYAYKVKTAQDSNTQIHFRGACNSACTLYLALPHNQLCVGQNARFGFHKPYGASQHANQRAEVYLLKKYPEWVRAWVRKTGGLKNGMRFMSYQYASQYLPTC